MWFPTFSRFTNYWFGWSAPDHWRCREGMVADGGYGGRWGYCIWLAEQQPLHRRAKCQLFGAGSAVRLAHASQVPLYPTLYHPDRLWSILEMRTPCQIFFHAYLTVDVWHFNNALFFEVQSVSHPPVRLRRLASIVIHMGQICWKYSTFLGFSSAYRCTWISICVSVFWWCHSAAVKCYSISLQLPS